LLQKHNESTYRLEYTSTNYGNLPLNSTVTRKEILDGIEFNAMPGNVYDFKLYESDQLLWDYAIVTEPSLPEYINIAELSPDGTQGRIRWGHPISGGFTYYILKILKNDEPFRTEVAKSGSFGLLGTIQPDVNYEVRVFTVYLTKQSKKYSSIKFSTELKPPTNVILNGRNSTSLSIGWQTPKEYHCSYWEQDIKYNISIKIPGQNTIERKFSEGKKCLNQDYSLTFDGLIPGQVYEITLQTMYKNLSSTVVSNQFLTFY